MSAERINAALRDATDTQTVEIGPGALATVAEVFEQSFGDRTAIVVTDENIWAVAGEEVQRNLEAAGRDTAEPYIFPGKPTLYAGYDNIQILVEALRPQDAIPVAVGSGTLNDIVKRAAYELERPYMNVATAASMDGYTAFGASIEKDNKKQTLTCPAPRAVVGDVEVLVNAPERMTASGYADLLGKVTAGADWLVADALGVEPISQKVWSLVQDSLRDWTERPAELRGGDQAAMDGLIEGLILSGLAMQSHQSSRPASGAEHQFSHLWEGEGLGRDLDPPLSHGFKVGVGSIAIAALFERVLERDLSNIDVDALCASWPAWEDMEKSVREAYSGSKLEQAAVNETQAKYIDADTLRERLERLREVWPELRGKVEEQLMPAGELREQLRAAGCPTSPEEIGLSREEFKATYFRAQMLRRRYTILDLALETGILDECVEELFAPDGFWASDTASQEIR
ncbi:MAG TPA: sn-glycerol-1-phosphate dehydrogenase [Rubrobacteraceae bacterium]|nr:sn-glycerol-1-phosphate dehydrogenase [Rubrobacteraceae bacterium]